MERLTGTFPSPFNHIFHYEKSANRFPLSTLTVFPPPIIFPFHLGELPTGPEGTGLHPLPRSDPLAMIELS